jgi:single-strand DNA-binding protein
MLNRATIMGRLTRDPELRRTGSGIAVTSFTVAVDRDFENNGERETDFIDCVAWRGVGEFVARNFHKGKMIVVSGRIQQRNWKDKDGNKRRTTEVVADEVYFGDSKKDAPGGNANAKENPGQDFAQIEDEDAQLPF